VDPVLVRRERDSVEVGVMDGSTNRVNSFVSLLHG